MHKHHIFSTSKLSKNDTNFHYKREFFIKFLWNKKEKCENVKIRNTWSEGDGLSY
jgi:hypothetical protein